MESRPNLFHTLGEWWDSRQAERSARATADPDQPAPRLSRWLPTRGNVLFTLLLVGLLVLAQTVGALPSARQQGTAPDAPSTGTIAYQGRLADANGNPLTSTVPMIFRLYDAANGGVPLWEEQWTGSSSVQISDGLFNVMLGSLAPIPASLITSHSSLFLGITVGTDDEMAPRVQLGSVPFAVQALTVPDGSITSKKLNLSDGLLVTGPITTTGGVHMDGSLSGPYSHLIDNRPYIRFLKQDGVTDASLCPEGGTAVGAASPAQSLHLRTGNDIATAAFPNGGTCINVHSIAPCATIIGNHFPYPARSCTDNFAGRWAPFSWTDGTTTHDVTSRLLGSGISCYDVMYACVNLNP